VFFESWYGMLRVVIVAPLAYGGLVLILPVSGKRTLAKLNAYDLVVTVALGSILATILLSKTVPLLEGLRGRQQSTDRPEQHNTRIRLVFPTRADSVKSFRALTAFVILAAMQFVVAWLSVRVGWFNNLVKSEPTLLLHNGEFLDRALLAERVTRDDVRAALRSSGVGDASEASAVVLETDGSISVIKAQSAAP